MSKKGSPYFKKVLFQTVLTPSNTGPVLNNYYQKKRAEDKYHKTYIGAVALNICNIIYVVLKLYILYST